MDSVRTSLPAPPNIILEGGVAGRVGPQPRTHYAVDPGDMVKLDLGNRYEHFAGTSRTRAVDGRVLRVFEWVRTTYVAE